MKNTSGILLNNAYESWALAVKTAHEIMSGMVTLQKRKQFVSSLHNAVELFLKQIMINKGDHRVATVKANKLDADSKVMKDTLFYGVDAFTDANTDTLTLEAPDSRTWYLTSGVKVFEKEWDGKKTELKQKHKKKYKG